MTQDSGPVFRADLSNPAVSVSAGAKALSIRSRPKLATAMMVACGLLLAFSIFVLAVQLHRPVSRWMDGQGFRVSPEATIIAAIPLAAWVCMLSWIIVSWRKPRGIDIFEGMVILHVPEQTPSTLSFHLAELKGAQLRPLGNGEATVLIRRRGNGSSVTVMSGHDASLLGTSVDLINSYVMDIEHHAFEVIQVAQAVTPTTEPRS